MNSEMKWKSLDGECLFQDEQGNVFYSSPEPDFLSVLLLLPFATVAVPFLMAIAFKLGGL